jgi:hypothetical protein
MAVRRQLVADYLNSVPLAAIAGHGEVNGIGDGLWAVYGADFHEVNRLLGDGYGSNDGSRARAYKQILSLLIAQRRPAFYLVTNRDPRVDEQLPAHTRKGESSLPIA